MTETKKGGISVGPSTYELDLSRIGDRGVFRQPSSYHQREPLAGYGFGGSRYQTQESQGAVLAKVTDFSNLAVKIAGLGLVESERILASGAFDDPLITVIPGGSLRLYESWRKQRRGVARSADFQPVVNSGNQIEWRCLGGYPEHTGDIVDVLARESQPGGILHGKTVQAIEKTFFDGLLSK